jgi:protein FAM32A
MPADEYASTIRGGLKLKGGAPGGIKKKKKKARDTSSSSESKASALQKALEDEDAAAVVKKGKGKEGEEDLDEDALRELEERGDDGKTASERAHEEMRRKRVCCFLLSYWILVLEIEWR